jgi:hypothetical protein
MLSPYNNTVMLVKTKLKIILIFIHHIIPLLKRIQRIKPGMKYDPLHLQRILLYLMRIKG